MKIVLFQPQIPQNTGNIVRTCAVTGSDLILVKPLGFSISNRWLKRAGLDYWEGVNVQIVDDLQEVLDRQNSNYYFLSSKAEKSYYSIKYDRDDYLIFGSETAGLPAELHKKYKEKFLNIPMKSGARCLNLATSAGIVLYEALRQQENKGDSCKLLKPL